MCQDFLKGYCPVGSECKKKHQDIGATTTVKRRTGTKKVAPAKPKRTSILVIPQDDDDVTAPAPSAAPCAAAATAAAAQRVPRYYENLQEVDEEYRATEHQLELVETISAGAKKFFFSILGIHIYLY